MWDRILDRQLASLIRLGDLELTFPDGRTRSYGNGSAPRVRVTILADTVVRQLVLNPGLALGEAYMNETLTIADDDLHGLLELALKNRSRPRAQHDWAGRIAEHLLRLQGLLRQTNTVGRSRRNAAHHYDLSGELYSLFLDADRQYSCAYFPREGMTLDEAQVAKKRLIARKLLLEPGQHVLDIGCGWGGLALSLAQDHGVRVTGITLSREQHEVATRRVEEAGLSDRIDIRLSDYREIGGSFDRIVSVGMFEHVGAPNYRKFFRQVHELLADDGVALIHTIARAEPPGHTNTFIRRYIFPGGYIPALSETALAIEKENLFVTDVEVLRLHYAETLRHWQERFNARIDEARALYDDRFCRMWRFYLCACEQAFRYGRQCVMQFQLAKQQDAAPLTRDYLCEATAKD